MAVSVKPGPASKVVPAYHAKPIKIDSLNQQLIKLLRQDAYQSSEVLAKELQVSPATIRRRLRKLLDSNTVRIVAMTAPDKVGLNLPAIITLDVTHEKMDLVGRALAEMPEVRWVSTTTGRFDIQILAYFSCVDELYRFMQSRVGKLDGVRNSEISVCLDLKEKAL